MQGRRGRVDVLVVLNIGKHSIDHLKNLIFKIIFIRVQAVPDVEVDVLVVLMVRKYSIYQLENQILKNIFIQIAVPGYITFSSAS